MNVLKSLLALGLLCWVIAALRQEKADAVKIQEPGQASDSELMKIDPSEIKVKVQRGSEVKYVVRRSKAIPYSLK